MKSLLIGRFQPFHKGHLQIIKDIYKQYEEIIIGIGSSQYNHTLNDPFTSDERKLMIDNSLENIDINNYIIALIPDIHNYSKWVDYVTSILPDFDVLITNNILIKDLFTKKEYYVKETPLFNKNKYSGKEIRRRIINDEPWDNLVPKPVFDIINYINGVKRLKRLSKNKI